MFDTGKAGEAEVTGGAHNREIVREGVTMAMYVSLSLLAVVLATPEITRETRADVAFVAFATVCGLLFAHMLAFEVSTRLVSAGRVDAQSRRVLGAQVAGGMVVAAVVTIPALIFTPKVSLVVAELLLICFVGVVAFVAARGAGASNLRSLTYTMIVLAASMVVLLVKGLVGH
ncbi:MAG: hypothetical protein WCP28_21460 [Actinomycetes bacterium]